MLVQIVLRAMNGVPVEVVVKILEELSYQGLKNVESVSICFR